jgi:hypothetical protein
VKKISAVFTVYNIFKKRKQAVFRETSERIPVAALKRII